MVESEAKELTKRHARRRDVRPQGLPAGDRRDHQAGREGRQGAARLQPPTVGAGKGNARSVAEADLRAAYKITEKQERYAAVDAVKAKVKARCCRPKAKSQVAVRQGRSAVFKELEAKIVRWNILDTGKRIDGRDLKTVRPIVAEVGVLPRTHGSALFTRGETQAMVVATLGTGEDEQYIDALKAPTRRTSCCTTTSRPTRSVKWAAWARPAAAKSATASSPGARCIRCCRRREFPYTIRVVSEITESNGSSSMATVCGASLALMDAGVPLKRRWRASRWA
jgi:polyribonucleotide nucleotidyltransferase